MQSDQGQTSLIQATGVKTDVVWHNDVSRDSRPKFLVLGKWTGGDLKLFKK